eukprot:gene22855-biopygen4270
MDEWMDGTGRGTRRGWWGAGKALSSLASLARRAMARDAPWGAPRDTPRGAPRDAPRDGRGWRGAGKALSSLAWIMEF